MWEEKKKDFQNPFFIKRETFFSLEFFFLSPCSTPQLWRCLKFYDFLEAIQTLSKKNKVKAPQEIGKKEGVLIYFFKNKFGISRFIFLQMGDFCFWL